MKKRSLFAAVAMLIVSALVLTSATYAWFVSNSSASVNMDEGTVASAGQGIQVRSHQNNAQWGSSLEYSPSGATPVDTLSTSSTDTLNDSHFASTYSPVSTTDLGTWYYTSIGSGNAYASFLEATAGTQYTQYCFDVRTASAGDHAVGTLTVSGTAGSALRVLVEKKLSSGSYSVVGCFSTHAETWNGIISQPAGGLVDKISDNYVTTADFDTGITTTDYLQSISCLTANGLAIDFGAVGTGSGDSGDTYGTVRVTIWIEGNDSECYANAMAGKKLDTAWSWAAYASDNSSLTGMFTSQNPINT